MIRTMWNLFPREQHTRLVRYSLLAVLGVVCRAAGAIVLIPLVVALFSDNTARAWPWLGLLACVTVAGWIIDYRVAQIGSDLGFKLLDHTQRSTADRLSDIRLNWLNAENTAIARDAIAATGPDLVGMMIYLVTPLVSALLLPVTIALALLAVSLPLGLVALAGVVVLLASFLSASRLGREADRDFAARNSALTERIIEFGRTQQALRAARRVDSERSIVGTALKAQHGAALRLLLMQIPGQLIFSIASQLALLALGGTTVLLTIRGDLSAAEAVALIVVIARFLEPFAALGELAPAIESTTIMLGRLQAVLDAPRHRDPRGTGEDQRRGGGSAHLPAWAPMIEFKGVSFRYSADSEAIIQDLNLVLEPGSTTAIVGPSGSGKSTLLALLAGLYEPTGGSILVDGIDTAQLDLGTRRALVSVVFQHPYLFDGTIAENIVIGKPNATSEDIATVSALARLDGDSAGLDQGLNTRVGEAGSALSGGERQRVSIARALIKPAPILLIDEATSALDTENEGAIVRVLTADRTPRTRVVVAHRLASIRTADRALFLENGTIVEDGPVDQLLGDGGRFAEFWKHQESAGGWRMNSPLGAGDDDRPS